MRYCIALVMLLAFVPAVSGDKIDPAAVTPPVLIEKHEPSYTEEARGAKLEGTVRLRVTIDTDGKTKDITVIRGLGHGLDEKAVEAVATWRFQPAKLKKDNTPVAVTTNVEVNFRLL